MAERRHACGIGVAIVILIWSLLFNAYIVARFLRHPRPDWRSVSNYGASTAGSMTMLAHWLGGLVVNAVGPLQMVTPLRRRCPAAHRWAGRAYVLALMTASVGGLAYVWVRRTVGGLQMDISFTLYGVACFVSGAGAGWYGWRRRRRAHRRWGLRALSLGLGSAFYRLLILPMVSLPLVASDDDDAVVRYLNAAAWGMWAPYVLVETRLAYEMRIATKPGARPLAAADQPANKADLV